MKNVLLRSISKTSIPAIKRKVGPLGYLYFKESR